MLTVYDFLDSGNGYKIRLLLTQLNRPFRLEQVDILKGESRTARFLAMNPNGKIPIVKLEDGSCLSESNAIMFYLAEGSPFLPDDPLARARVLQWLFFEQNLHEPNIASRRFQMRHVDPAERSEDLLAQKLELGYQALDVMEQRLAQHRFLVEDSYSIADIGLFAYTHLAEEGGYELSRYPGIVAWCKRISEQPAFKAFNADW